jgi:hypothetical protein
MSIMPSPPPPDYVDPLRVLKPTKPKYAIWIASDAAIYTRFERPNVVRRFFLRAFFGWRWVRVENEAKD